MATTLQVLHRALGSALAGHELNIPTTISWERLTKSKKKNIDQIKSQKHALSEVENIAIYRLNC